MAFPTSPPKPSPERIAEFKDDFLRGRAAFGALEKALRHFDALEERREPSKDDAFGFNLVMEAEPWLSNSQWGPAPSWDLAVAQERFLLAKFEAALRVATSQTDQAESEPVPSTAQDIVSAAGKLSNLLSAKGFAPQLVVIASALPVEVLVDFNSRLASPFWALPKELQANWLLGADDGKLYLHWPEPQQPTIYVMDTRKFGRLVQFGDGAELTVTPMGPKFRVRLYESFRVEVEQPKAVWGAPLRG